MISLDEQYTHFYYQKYFPSFCALYFSDQGFDLLRENYDV
jgi:hypothetical protein